MKKSQIVIWSILIALVFVHYFYMPERPEVTRGEMQSLSTPGSADPTWLTSGTRLYRSRRFRTSRPCSSS